MISLFSILKKIVAHKLQEIEQAKSTVSINRLKSELPAAPPVRNFLAALQNASPDPGIGLIAEVKKASPSKGVIRDDFDPVSIARDYAAAGAHCISVLTDHEFFQGHLDFLKAIRTEVQIPILRKDFILDEYQVFEARASGADAVLLIAECLEAEQMQMLYNLIVELGMTALVELYDEKNVEPVLSLDPTLVGVNNRDLNTFEVDLQHTVRMRKRLPSHILVVGESGIFTHEDALLLSNSGVGAMLVGESLMRQKEIGAAVKNLLGT